MLSLALLIAERAKEESAKRILELEKLLEEVIEIYHCPQNHLETRIINKIIKSLEERK